MTASHYGMGYMGGHVFAQKTPAQRQSKGDRLVNREYQLMHDPVAQSLTPQLLAETEFINHCRKGKLS